MCYTYAMVKKEGFTLIELVVVMAIIAVLAALVVGAINVAKRTMTETANRQNAQTMRACFEAFYAKYKFYCELDPTIHSPNPPYVKCEPSSGSFTIFAGWLSDSGIPCNLSDSAYKDAANSKGGAVGPLNPQSGTLTIYSGNSYNIIGSITLP